VAAVAEIAGKMMPAVAMATTVEAATMSTMVPVAVIALASGVVLAMIEAVVAAAIGRRAADQRQSSAQRREYEQGSQRAMAVSLTALLGQCIEKFFHNK